jgi:hypothetical protein
MGRRLLVLVIALGLAAAVTVPKLDKMAQIKGWLPGGTVQTRVITGKWHQTPEEDPDGADTYWIALTAGDIRQPGSHRLTLPADQWASLREGDGIEVVYVPGDPQPYRRDGIFVSLGNFLFDVVLLALELGTAGLMGWQLWRLRSRVKEAQA